MVNEIAPKNIVSQNQFRGKTPAFGQMNYEEEDWFVKSDDETSEESQQIKQGKLNNTKTLKVMKMEYESAVIKD